MLIKRGDVKIVEVIDDSKSIDDKKSSEALSGAKKEAKVLEEENKNKLEIN